MTIGFITREGDESFEIAVKDLRQKYPEHTFLSSCETDKVFIIESSDALVVTYFSEEEAKKADKLKIVFVPFVGINSLPGRYFKEKGIAVSNTHWNSRFVAEKALGLTLALLGRTVEFHNLLGRGVWSGFLAKDKAYQNWTSLYNKKCTILGYGSIGRALSKLLKAFGCEVTAFKRNTEGFEDDNIDFVTNNLKTAIDFGDVVFFTLPLTKQTRHILNESNMNWLNGKYVVNVGRGKLIKEEPFYQGLKNYEIKGAAIDVWYRYPNEELVSMPFHYPFHMLDNVVLSPHTASDAYEGIEDWVDTTISRVEKYLDTGEILNRVDLNRGY